jgi:hypothetical protein
MNYIFEVRKYNGENKIFVNDQLFDWGIDENALDQIKNIKDEEEIKNINISIRNYFLDSLGEFLGKKISIKELYNALKVGYLEV